MLVVPAVRKAMIHEELTTNLLKLLEQVLLRLWKLFILTIHFCR